MNKQMSKREQHLPNWNAAGYQDQFSYVWQYGNSLLSQLNAQPKEQILDLGCGTGQLSAQIAESGASVLGIDSDTAMVTQARGNYPELPFKVGSADDFQLEGPVDAVFSNAVLHWVTDAGAAAVCMARALKPGGRLVAEFGGEGNVKTILNALAEVSGEADMHPWYFPGLGEYVALLASVGLKVTFAHLFDRPTPLGEAGLAGWLTMFSQRFLPPMSPDEWAAQVKAVEAKVPELYQENEWVADYRRLRVVAVKPC